MSRENNLREDVETLLEQVRDPREAEHLDDCRIACVTRSCVSKCGINSAH